MVKRNSHDSRPLSPHLSIYKPQISSVLSILHRISGVYLFACAILFCWMFFCISLKEYEVMRFDITVLFGTMFFRLVLLSVSTCFYYHIFNGIRHLFWDLGFGFEIRTMNITGIIVLFLTFICASATAFFIL